MVQIGEHNTKQDKFVLYDDTKDTLWKGKASDPAPTELVFVIALCY